MRYKCLVLDHDDTAVDSTAQIHYPAFLEALKVLRPGVTISLEDYFRENFHPGFVPYCREKLGMDDAELETEVKCWAEYVKNHIPAAYQGIKEVIERQKAEGGLVCVVSHSYDYNILRDYEANGLPRPDMIFGWEQSPEERKPSPHALQVIMKTYDLEPKDLIMVDDLKPGYDMAKSCGVDFAGAGWANDIPEIRAFMKQNSNYYFKTVKELKDFLFS